MRCDRCSVQIERGDYIQSRFTKKRFCKDFTACDKRRLKLLKVKG